MTRRGFVSRTLAGAAALGVPAAMSAPRVAASAPSAKPVPGPSPSPTDSAVSSLTYRALALQVVCQAVNGAETRAEAQRQMLASVERIGAQLGASKAFIGPDCRLVVLPEYFLTSFPLGEPIEAWGQKAAVEMDGPVYDALGRVAQAHGVFLSGNAYELDDHFPGLYFQTSFCLDPSGDVVLRYRRLNSMFTPTPHDVLDRYLDVYGADGLFPVADTEIGRLAAVASEEILYPEVARALALRGAEVLLHSTSEPFGYDSAPKDIAKQARALENLAYVVSANSAGITGTPIPASSTDGGSKVLDYEGRVLAEAGPGESMAAYAALDLDALRRYRRRPGMSNLLARQRIELYAATYTGPSVYPPNTMADGPPPRAHFRQTLQSSIDRLAERGVI